MRVRAVRRQQQQKQRQRGDARGHGRKTVSRFPSFIKGYFRLGQALMQCGRYRGVRRSRVGPEHAGEAEKAPI